ncbi:MAG: tetratricopeptide repeat protein [Methanoregula sp.]|nr:tetratricopeptide repeat protein [Methanoregula sp.]MDD5144495.1 tetratricopeptide repeat protein [Methanoregula sp.]
MLSNNLGCCLMEPGQYEDAIQSFDRALAINPGLKEAQANRAAAEQILKQYDRSEAADWTLLFGKTNPV